MGEPAPADLLARLHAETRIPDPAIVQQINKGSFVADAVGHADITDILLTHDPCWTWAPFARDETGLPRITVDKSGRLAMWAELTIHGVTRLEVGTCLATSPDPLKELVGDFLRRGAMRFGVALALWSKSEWKEVSVATGGSAAGAGPAPVRGSAAADNGPGPSNVTTLPTPSDSDVARHPANGPRLPRDQAIAARARDLGLTDEEREEAIWQVTNHRTRSGKELRAGEGTLVFAELDAMAKAKQRG